MKKYLIIGLGFIYGCSSEKESDLIVPCPEDFVVTVPSSTQPGCQPDGVISVNSTGGEGSVVYSIDGSTFQAASTFENLAAGDYTITARDDNGCLTTIQTSLSAGMDAITLNASVLQTAGCGTSSGTVEVQAAGGSGNYEFALDGGSFGASNTFSDLASGSYTVTGRDDEGCESTVDLDVFSGVSLSGDILPIINASCAISGCHLNMQPPILDSESAIINSANQIRGEVAGLTMPPSGALPQNQIDLISCWVDDGAPNN